MSGQLQLRRGTTAQNDTFTGAVGELTYNTDDGSLISHDGVTAGGYPGGGYLAAPGAVVSNVQAKLQETVSVKDFGAVGDGVADDTAAIQTAVTNSSGKAIYFPSGTYLLSAAINLISNIKLYGDGNSSVVKVAAGTYVPDNKQLFVATLDGFGIGRTNIGFENLKIDGNKGNIGTTRNPLITLFKGSNYFFTNVMFFNCEGICTNISNVTNDVHFYGCNFVNCGGNPNNSDGYRNQGIALSNALAQRTRNVSVVNCAYDLQGLDCISLQNCDDVLINNNYSKNSYVLYFNVQSPYFSTNVLVTNNYAFNTTSSPVVDAVPPGVIDMPGVRGGVVSNNTINTCDSSAIGIFGNSENVIVCNNTIINPAKRWSSFAGGISVGAGTAQTPPNNISVTNNTIVNTNASTAMPFGIFIQSTCTNLYVNQNLLSGFTTSKFGYYVTPNPSASNNFALTSNSPLAATIVINDIDLASGTITNWRKQNTLTTYSVNGTQVVTTRQAAIANGADATVNLILSALRTHGLIAT